MKKLRKILALALAMVMALGMSVTSFATEQTDFGTHTYKQGTGKTGDTGTVILNGIEETNAKVYAFPIVKAVYGGHDGLFSGYEAVYTSISVEEVLSPTGALEDKLATLVKNFAFNNNGEYESGAEETPILIPYSNGVYTKDVAIGSYLVVITGADTKIYSPAIVSVSYVGRDNGDNIANTTFDIAGTSTWVKVRNQPTIGKTSATLDASGDPKSGDAARTANIGDTIQYTVEVDPIPYFEGKHPKLKIVDTLGAGLTFAGDASTVVVKANDILLAKDTDYTADITGQVLTVDFVVGTEDSKAYTLNAKQGQKLTITYKATVNDDSKMNSDANENDAKLYFSKDSNVDSADDSNPPSSKTYNYTFDLSATINGSKTTSFVRKTGESQTTGEDAVALPGAVFTLYTEDPTDNNNAAVYSNPAGTTNGITNGIVTSKEDGALIIRGLAAGTYWLKEKTAPAGYSLNTKVYPIEIVAEYYTADDEKTNSANKAGTLKAWTVKIDNVNVASATITGGTKNEVAKTENKTSYDILNTRLSALPSTGGIGTTIFTIGGCAIMIIAAGLYFATRRKTAK